MGRMPKLQMKEADSPPSMLTENLDDLVEFWRTVMKGHIVIETENGKLANSSIPMELRLKASELLAKYTEKGTSSKKSVAKGNKATATVDILNLAKLIEQSGSISNDDIEQAFDSVPKDD